MMGNQYLRFMPAKENVKSLCFIKHYTMKAYEEVEV
jgi:hypothetical protein